MAARQYRSTVEAKTLSSGINNSVTSMTLNSVTTLPSTYPYTLVIDPDLASEEIVTVTASGGGTALTITRGQDGTSAQPHSASAVVKHMITARDLQEPHNHIDATSNVHGVTGSIAPLASPTFTGTVVLPSATSIGNVTSTEISYVDGVTSSIQTQLDAKAPSASPTFTGTVTLPTGTVTSEMILNGTIVNADINASAAIDWTKLAVSSTVSSTELGYVDGVTSSIQTQLDSKAPLYPSTNAQTGTTYTLVLGDTGKYVEMNNASANTLTVPPNSSVAFPIGTEVTVIRTGAGLTTITPGAGVTINYYSVSGSATRSIKAQWAAATLIKRATDTWVLIGNLT